MSRCLASARDPSSSVANMTNASPVALPSCFLTNKTPPSPSRTAQPASSPPDSKNSTCRTTTAISTDNIHRVCAKSDCVAYHLFGRAVVRQSAHAHNHLAIARQEVLRFIVATCSTHQALDSLAIHQPRIFTCHV